MDKDLNFKLRRIASFVALDDYGIVIDDDRPKIESVVEAGRDIWRAVLAVATKEETIAEVPADWWQHFKLQCFPERLKRRWPVKYYWVVAYHTFPELPVPDIGQEFVQVRIIKPTS